MLVQPKQLHSKEYCKLKHLQLSTLGLQDLKLVSVSFTGHSFLAKSVCEPFRKLRYYIGSYKDIC